MGLYSMDPVQHTAHALPSIQSRIQSLTAVPRFHAETSSANSANAAHSTDKRHQLSFVILSSSIADVGHSHVERLDLGFKHHHQALSMQGTLMTRGCT